MNEQVQQTKMYIYVIVYYYTPEPAKYTQRSPWNGSKTTEIYK